MSSGAWGRSKDRESRAVDEKAYRRRALAAWDARWHGLSVQARFLFLNDVKGPIKKQTVHSQPPSVSINLLPTHVLKELVAAGFVEVQAARSRAFTDRVIACEGIYDFATRVRALRRLHLLAADRPSEFGKYVDYAFYGSPLLGVLGSVLRKAGIDDLVRLDEILQRYVTHHRWPGWVARALKEPLAEQVLDVVREAEGPIPLAGLIERIPGSEPDEIRAVVDRLIAHLGLVEDLNTETWELMVGLLPAVREELIRASQPRERPPLVVCETPRELGPDGGMLVSDLRALLLEAVSEPPRLRQDHALFQKEVERFQDALEPLAPWLMKALSWTPERRLNQTLGWVRALQFVGVASEGKTHRLLVRPKGHQWLASGLDAQYARVYSLFTAPAARHDLYAPDQGVFYGGVDPFSNLGPGDMRFLGEHVSAMSAEKPKRPPYYWDARPEDHHALRRCLDQALAQLKPEVFYRLESVESHLVFGEHNPLNLGLAPERVAVFWGSRPVPPLEEQREEAGRRLLDGFVRRRLIPLGCVRAALDDAGRVCIARTTWLDGYFGREVAPSGLADASETAARVVVQPDFSVIVIGLNPVPAAELAPFCERARQGGSPGAMVLKITRESVVKAVSHGLNPAEIVDRLQRHASGEVPANVLCEVESWSHWVRQVHASTLTVLRCPDRETADRLMAALKRQGERVNDTLVAVDPKTLNATERTKLRTHGIIVQGDLEPREGRSKTRRRR